MTKPVASSSGSVGTMLRAKIVRRSSLVNYTLHNLNSTHREKHVFGSYDFMSTLSSFLTSNYLGVVRDLEIGKDANQG